MKVLRIHCHCGHRLADCQPHPATRFFAMGAVVDGDTVVLGDPSRAPGPSRLAPPEGHPNLLLNPRPGVEQRRHQPAGQVIAYTWICPRCGRRPSRRGHFIGALYEQHRTDPRRVVHVHFGREL